MRNGRGRLTNLTEHVWLVSEGNRVGSTPHDTAVAGVLSFGAGLPDGLPDCVPVAATLETTKSLSSHQAHIGRTAVDPGDEPLGDICWLELTTLDETPGNTQREFRVICDRACWLPVCSTTEHLCHLAMFAFDFDSRVELHWTAQCVTTGQSQNEARCSVSIHFEIRSSIVFFHRHNLATGTHTRTERRNLSWTLCEYS